MKCRFCERLLENVFLDLGTAPLSNGFISENELKSPESYFPLKVFICNQCWLVQVNEHTDKDRIFNHNYAYFSSFSSSWITHAKNYANYIIDRLKINKKSNVIEIGSNDGYLLQFFKTQGIPCTGMEPSGNTAQAAIAKGIPTINCFFSQSFAQNHITSSPKADLVIGNNVLAHVPDINDFISGLKTILKPNGVITMEFPHLLNLIRHLQFDTIYHEHFSYLSLSVVNEFFKANELHIFDVEKIPTHGGSLRIFASHTANKKVAQNATIAAVLKEENSVGLLRLPTYLGFQSKIDKLKNDFLAFLVEKRRQGKIVAGYGAAAKGNTLLNYAGVKQDLICFVSDASPHKQGKYLPGSRIPVVEEKRIKEIKPDFLVLLPWNIQEELIEQLSYIRDWGGSFVVAIPQVAVI